MKRVQDSHQNETSKKLSLDISTVSIETEQEYRTLLEKMETNKFEKLNYFDIVSHLLENPKTHSWIFISKSDLLHRYRGNFLQFLKNLVPIVNEHDILTPLIPQFLSLWLDQKYGNIINQVLDSIPLLLPLDLSLWSEWVMSGLFVHFPEVLTMIEKKTFKLSNAIQSNLDLDILPFLTFFLTEFGERIKKKSNKKILNTLCNGLLMNDIISTFISSCTDGDVMCQLILKCLVCVPSFEITCDLEAIVRTHSLHPVSFFTLFDKILVMNPEKIDLLAPTIKTLFELDEATLDTISHFFPTLFTTLTQFRKMDDFFAWYDEAIPKKSTCPIMSHSAFRIAFFNACCEILPTLALQCLTTKVEKLTKITELSILPIITLMNSIQLNRHISNEMEQIATQILIKLNPFQFNWTYLNTYYTARRVLDTCKEFASSIYTLQKVKSLVWLDCIESTCSYPKMDLTYPLKSIITVITIQRMIHVSTQFNVYKYNGMDASSLQKDFEFLFGIISPWISEIKSQDLNLTPEVVLERMTQEKWSIFLWNVVTKNFKMIATHLNASELTNIVKCLIQQIRYPMDPITHNFWSGESMIDLETPKECILKCLMDQMKTDMKQDTPTCNFTILMDLPTYYWTNIDKLFSRLLEYDLKFHNVSDALLLTLLKQKPNPSIALLPTLLSCKNEAVIEALVTNAFLYMQNHSDLMNLFVKAIKDKDVKGVYLVFEITKSLYKHPERMDLLIDFYKTIPLPKQIQTITDSLMVLNWIKLNHKWNGDWAPLQDIFSHGVTKMTPRHLESCIISLCQIEYPKVDTILDLLDNPSSKVFNFVIARCRLEPVDSMKQLVRDSITSKQWMNRFQVLITKKYPWLEEADVMQCIIKMSQHIHQEPLAILNICSKIMIWSKKTFLGPIINLITMTTHGSIWNKEIYLTICEILTNILSKKMIEKPHFVHLLDLMRNILNRKVDRFPLPALVKIYSALNFAYYATITDKLVTDYIRLLAKRKTMEQIKTWVIPLLQWFDVQLLYTRLIDHVEKGLLKEMETEYIATKSKFIKI